MGVAIVTPTSAKDRNAILALLDRWRSATAARDTGAILELVEDDIVFLPSSTPPIKGKAQVEQMYRTFFPQYGEIRHEAVIEEIEVAVDWAFLWGTDELFLTTYSGEQIHMKGKGITVLKRGTDGSWKVWRGINNMTRQTE
jgi:uncharacterized protein (TIGR02246 family)